MSFTPKGYERFSTLSGQQQSILDQLLPLLQGRLGGGDKATFEAPYKREFEERTVPRIAERFAGLGAQSSSGFQNALGQAGAGLSEQLAGIGAQREDASLNQLMQLLGMNTEGLIPKEKPWWQEALGGASSGLGQGLGMLGGGLGGGILQKLLSLLGGK